MIVLVLNAGSSSIKYQLYDIEKDRSQTTNVYADHPEVVKELSALLKSL